MFNKSMFNKSALVVAHPDDEIVWFNSILDKVNKIYICYLHSSVDETLKDKRLKMLTEYPLKDKIICLDEGRIEIELEESLEAYRVVFTHNPWGENGHKHHIRIHNLIKELQHKHKFELWVSGFSSDRFDLRVNPEMTKIRKLYIKHDCWTLTKDTWPKDESFWRIPK